MAFGLAAGKGRWREEVLQPRKLGALVTLSQKLARTSVTWKTGPVSPKLVTSGEAVREKMLTAPDFP